MAGITHRLLMAYIKKKPPFNDDAFDLEWARDEWQVLRLWDALPDCFKTTRVKDQVFQLVQLSPDLIIKMNINRLNNDY
jgi:hypothetical protein